jgi:3-oxoacyl-[acyl-carrier-protein] synthase II
MGGASIVGWSAVSPFGIGRESFVAGLNAGESPAVPLQGDDWQVPDERACLVPGFEQRQVLGKKGTRSMDRVTGLAVSAVRDLLADVTKAGIDVTGGSTGLVLATTTGSAQSMMDFTRASMTAERPFYVDPALMPNAVMNCAAGQSAIWHGLNGPNATIAGGSVGGLTALGYANRLLRTGRASKVVCGGAEEYSHARSWLVHHSRGEDERIVLGEGAGMVLLEPADGPHQAPVLARVLATEFRVYLEGDIRSAVLACVRAALRTADAGPEDVWAVVTSATPGLPGELERDVLAGLFGEPALTRAAGPAVLGDTGAASATFGILALLAAAEHRPQTEVRLGVVTSLDHDGTVGAAVLELQGQAGEARHDAPRRESDGGSAK